MTKQQKGIYLVYASCDNQTRHKLGRKQDARHNQAGNKMEE
jgi:hypothetical protein